MWLGNALLYVFHNRLEFCSHPMKNGRSFSIIDLLIFLKRESPDRF